MLSVGSVKVLTSTTVLPYHFWLGVAQPEPKRKRQPAAV